MRITTLVLFFCTAFGCGQSHGPPPEIDMDNLQVVDASTTPPANEATGRDASAEPVDQPSSTLEEKCNGVCSTFSECQGDDDCFEHCMDGGRIAEERNCTDAFEEVLRCVSDVGCNGDAEYECQDAMANFEACIGERDPDTETTPDPEPQPSEVEEVVRETCRDSCEPLSACGHNSECERRCFEGGSMAYATGCEERFEEVLECVSEVACTENVESSCAAEMERFGGCIEAYCRGHWREAICERRPGEPPHH